VVNRIDVEPVLLRSDTEIERDVEDALLENAATEAFEVRVSVLDGKVTLRGTVDSWQEKRLAGTVAKGVRGVTGLENHIDVVPMEDRPDAEILADVQKALRWDALVDHAMIEVVVEDGVVMLSGVVGSAAEKRRAMLDARVGGVVTVDADDLEVKHWAREEELRKGKYVSVSDEEVRTAVEDALLFDPRVVSLAVTTRVDDGMVTLRGTVDNLKAKRAAERDAMRTVGVTSVRNRLRVRPEEPVSDERLEQRAAGAITRDP
jgi:osmotically-inducible protein OsmY